MPRARGQGQVCPQGQREQRRQEERLMRACVAGIAVWFAAVLGVGALCGR